MEPTLKQLLALPTKRLLAYYKVHRLDAMHVLNDADYLCPDWEVRSDTYSRAWRELYDSKIAHLEAIKSELDKREHIA
jgi:hypothetical protein